jgi:hypothetical protein
VGIDARRKRFTHNKSRISEYNTKQSPISDPSFLFAKTTMTTSIVPPQRGKINFAGMVGAKRRRMRSGGNVSTLSNNVPKSAELSAEPSMEEDDDDDDDEEEEKTAQTSKCKGSTTIPIFLKSESILSKAGVTQELALRKVF